MASLKNGRLKRKKYIGALFKKGKVLHLHPLRMVYLPCSAISSHQVLFAVSSRKVRSAVVRNKIKRRMREAYRLNKHYLKNTADTYFLIGYIYTGNSRLCNFEIVQERIIASLSYLSKIPIKNDHDAPQT